MCEKYVKICVMFFLSEEFMGSFYSGKSRRISPCVTSRIILQVRVLSDEIIL